MVNMVLDNLQLYPRNIHTELINISLFISQFFSDIMILSCMFSSLSNIFLSNDITHTVQLIQFYCRVYYSNID